ncbi:MAG TPA: hypothetical protein VNW06_01145 [Cytophagaceae bacterium]|jgi:hypothetical protein|nr:hypothetical protein [Cytophagaceae bacterium]
MENEPTKKPIKRVAVPTVSKELPSSGSVKEKKSRATQNIVLLLLFLFVSGIAYIVIFQKEFIAQYTSDKPTAVVVATDTTTQNTDSLSQEETTTIIGGDNSSQNTTTDNGNNNSVDYPKGSKYYLIAGTYIFLPYAEKCVARMKADGFTDAAIISTGEDRKFHRVYIQASTDGKAIRAKRDELISSKGMDVWVYAE